MKFISNIFFILLLNSLVFTQDYTIVSYTNEDGLASNIVHGILQDEIGFIWLATDAGLIRYDGSSFSLINEGLPSSYVKNLILYNNKICIATDMGVGSIEKNNNKFKYKSIISGSLSRNDTSVHFPKSMYVDRNNILWIFDMKDIFRISDDGIKKYPLDEKFVSEDYKRSFTMVEDINGKLIVVSWSGYFFHFNDQNDKFEKISFENEGKNNFSSIKLVNDELWVASLNGLYKLKASKNYSKISTKLMVELPNISTFYPNGKDEIFIGTWNDGLFEYNFKSKNLARIDKVESAVINSIVKDKRGALWIASDNGISILNTHLFKKIDLSKTDQINSRPYVRRLKLTGRSQLSFIASFNLFSLEFGNEEKFKINSLPVNESFGIIDYEKTRKGIWISHQNGLLEFYNSNYKVTFSHFFDKNRLEFLFCDDRGNLWGFSYYNNKICRISKDHAIQFFEESLTKGTLVQNIKQYGNKIYFAGFNKNFNYLFAFDLDTQKFKFIPLNKKFKSIQELHIFDFEKTSRGYIFASNRGLINYSHLNMEYLYFDIEKTPVTFRSLLVDNSEFWVGSDQGVFLHKEGNTAVFKKSSGLTNATISRHGIVKDKKGNIWVANASGLTYIPKANNNIFRTFSPHISTITVDSSDVVGKNIFLNNSNISLEYASLDFPTEKIKYLTKISGLSEKWQNRGSINFLELSKLPVGQYELLIKAKNYGYFWSKPTSYKFEIVPSWYFSNYMITIYSILLMIITWSIIYLLNRMKIKKLELKKTILEEQVTERTSQLKKEKEKVEALLEVSEDAKLKLQKANKSNIELINIIAHDLKNPLQSILGYEFVLTDEEISDEEVSDIFQSIFRSSKKMNSLITDYLESAEMDSENIEFKFVTCDINKIILDLIGECSDRAKQKEIRISYNSQTCQEIVVDKNWLKIAIYNLISNAIKYSPFGQSIYIACETQNGKLRCFVRDEGPGISREDQNNLFKKFQRLSAKPTGNETATGLGLYIVKDIVEKHNGSVLCDSELGKGSTFSIYLPLN